ncbi:cytoplasmic FMR1-interacting protein 2 isoform X3 [Histomonas meleagridis]|uniref:cytoplasmic FMR1-interacting protein 2 isoform X3 n=1 Tax=Histomonas meleagridis TaxID=135588 RepID=UPI00355A6584|nr:cytoplasmic FMR1-interacting protein 2 isoform X3 [Histomonas meleagridis]KAH0800311.1 cytoplasmic FMR1-interacting protein 2 isoform X3 [Histomonas meleagridis]
MSEDPLAAFEATLVSHDPSVIPMDAQIASPEPPLFNQHDVPYEGLYMQGNSDFQQLDTLQKLIDDTSALIPFLYSYRSVSRAIYNPENHIKAVENDPKKSEEIMKLFLAVFSPYFEKICALQSSLEEATNFIRSTICSMKEPPSNLFFEKLVELFDIILNLEQMKLVKVGLTVDLSLFRRRKDLTADEKQATATLPIFLGSPHHSLNQLKNYFKKNPNPTANKIFICFLDYCVNSYRKAILPKQKQALVISMLSSLFIFGQKALSSKDNMSTIYTMISEQPLIPLIGENHFDVTSIFKDIEGYSLPKGITIYADKEKLKAASSQFLIKNKIMSFRETYKSNLTAINSIIREGQVKDTNTLYEILSCISEMSNAIMTQFAYKSSCVASAPAGTSLYDCQVRLNYSPEDLDALIEIIGNIKTIAGTTLKAEPIIMKYIDETVGQVIQNFVQNTLGNALSSAKKKAQDSEKLFIAIRNVFGKFDGGLSPSQVTSKPVGDDKLSKIPPSIHQLEILREQIYLLLQSPSPLYDKKGKLISSFKHTVDEFESFLDETNNYSLLLQYTHNIRKASNLGSLWFRETALDIESKNNGILQFPVRSSLPFILAEHVLNASDKSSLHECVFFPFEIYNDAAYLALNTFQSQYLYKEIEAEVSVCVDMISFTFAHAFFKFSLEAAAAAQLPAECTGQINPKPIRYMSMVKQNTLQLLGSPVDFNLITTQKLNDTLEKELGNCISRITGLGALPYVSHLLKVCKGTHKFLRKNGLLLNDFDSIWASARMAQPNNPSTNLASALINVVDPPHLRFNSVSRRFLPTKDLMILPPNNEEWAHFYVRLHLNDSKFIGAEHCAALVEVLDDGEFTSFIINILGRINLEISKFIDVYAQVAPAMRLLSVSPNETLDTYFNFITDAYSEMKHPQLGALFNSLRNVGNLVALLSVIEGEMKPMNRNVSIMASVASIFKAHLNQNKDLFVANEFDPVNVVNHRTFPSVWSVLEFLLCTSKPVQLSDTLTISHPIETFGDGVIIAAHLFILLSGEEGLYQYDSIVMRVLRLFLVSGNNGNLPNSLTKFINYASITNQARVFSEILASPYADTK